MGITTASPLPSRRLPARCLEVGVRVTRTCGRWARRSPRCSEGGEGRCRWSLRPGRTPRLDIGISFARRSSRFALSITDSCGLARGHPGIELRRRPALDPARCDSAPKPSFLATGEISPASVSLSAAGWPTRRTACSFSPAVSLGDDGPFARVARPALSAVLSWLLLPPRAGPSRGTSKLHCEVAIDATGGFKAERTVRVVAGDLTGVPAYYRHEHYGCTVVLPTLVWPLCPPEIPDALGVLSSGELHGPDEAPYAAEHGDRRLERRCLAHLNWDSTGGACRARLLPYGPLREAPSRVRERRGKARGGARAMRSSDV